MVLRAVARSTFTILGRLLQLGYPLQKAWGLLMIATQRGVQRTSVKADIREDASFSYKIIMYWEGVYYVGIHAGHLWRVGGAPV